MLEVTVKVRGMMQSVLKKKKEGCSGKGLQKKVLRQIFLLAMELTSNHRVACRLIALRA